VVLRREAQDDRFVALLDLSRVEQGFRLGFLVRAAHVGKFVWPGTSMTGLSDPSVSGIVPPAHVEMKPDN
jgi:uncharacterized protein YfaS (alpha-2-macroglobulin family)